MKDEHNKTFFMDMNQSQNKTNTSLKTIKDETQEQSLEFGLDKMMEEVNIDIVDGIVNIAIPEPLFLMITSLLQKLNINLLNKEELTR